jgi:hypothetical protein
VAVELGQVLRQEQVKAVVVMEVFTVLLALLLRLTQDQVEAGLLLLLQAVLTLVVTVVLAL